MHCVVQHNISDNINHLRNPLGLIENYEQSLKELDVWTKRYIYLNKQNIEKMQFLSMVENEIDEFLEHTNEDAKLIQQITEMILLIKYLIFHERGVFAPQYGYIKYSADVDMEQIIKDNLLKIQTNSNSISQNAIISSRTNNQLIERRVFLVHLLEDNNLLHKSCLYGHFDSDISLILEKIADEEFRLIYEFLTMTELKRVKTEKLDRLSLIQCNLKLIIKETKRQMKQNNRNLYIRDFNTINLKNRINNNQTSIAMRNYNEIKNGLTLSDILPNQIVIIDHKDAQETIYNRYCMLFCNNYRSQFQCYEMAKIIYQYFQQYKILIHLLFLNENNTDCTLAQLSILKNNIDNIIKQPPIFNSLLYNKFISLLRQICSNLNTITINYKFNFIQQKYKEQIDQEKIQQIRTTYTQYIELRNVNNSLKQQTFELNQSIFNNQNLIDVIQHFLHKEKQIKIKIDNLQNEIDQIQQITNSSIDLTTCDEKFNKIIENYQTIIKKQEKLIGESSNNQLIISIKDKNPLSN
jgi:hypothetical protein